MGWRVGVGGPARLEELPTSWEQAPAALRLTSDLSPGEPGGLVLRHDDLGVLAALAAIPAAELDGILDLGLADDAKAAYPRALTTLDALGQFSSLRSGGR